MESSYNLYVPLNVDTCYSCLAVLSLFPQLWILSSRRVRLLSFDYVSNDSRNCVFVCEKSSDWIVRSAPTLIVFVLKYEKSEQERGDSLGHLFADSDQGLQIQCFMNVLTQGFFKIVTRNKQKVFFKVKFLGIVPAKKMITSNLRNGRIMGYFFGSDNRVCFKSSYDLLLPHNGNI